MKLHLQRDITQALEPVLLCYIFITLSMHTDTSPLRTLRRAQRRRPAKVEQQQQSSCHYKKQPRLDRSAGCNNGHGKKVIRNQRRALRFGTNVTDDTKPAHLHTDHL